MTTRRTRTIFSHDKVTITVIEDLELRAHRTNQMRYVAGDLRPIAVIVKERDRTYALDMAAQPIDIERLNLQSIGTL